MSNAVAVKQPQSAAIVPLDAGQLINKAIEANANIDTIERLVALREKLVLEQADRDLKTAISAFQGDCPEIKKDAAADRYNYASLGNIVKTIRPALAKHGLSYRYETTYGDKTCTVACIVMHENGGSYRNEFTSIISGPPKSNDQQQVGSTQSYGQRYSLTGALGLVVDLDDDASAGGRKPAPQSTGNEKPWYNSFDDEKGAMLADIESGKQTPDSIIKQLSADFRINKAVRQSISGLAS